LALSNISAGFFAAKDILFALFLTGIHCFDWPNPNGNFFISDIGRADFGPYMADYRTFGRDIPKRLYAKKRKRGAMFAAR